MLVASLLPTASAQELIPTVQALLSAQVDALSHVQSFGFTALQGSEASGDYVKTIWQESGVKYFLNYINENKDGPGVPFRLNIGYDGTQAYRVGDDGNRLLIRKAPFNEFETFSECNSPLFPFKFLQRKGDFLAIFSITTPEAVKDLVKHASFDPKQVRKIDGHDCLAVQFKDCYDGRQNESVNYTVYFAKDMAWFPLAWEMYGMDGRLRYSFIAKTFDHATLPGLPLYKVTFPITGIILQTPVSEHEGHAGVGITFPAVQLNKSETEDFTFDPTAYRYVEDMDSKVLINVPK